jgi:hypothetical protein
MYEPRVRLTVRELRALRTIEQALAAEDPALAGLLGSGTPRRRRFLLRMRHFLPRMNRATRITAGALLMFALATADVVLQTRGAMLLLIALLGLWWFLSAWARGR